MPSSCIVSCFAFTAIEAKACLRCSSACACLCWASWTCCCWKICLCCTALISATCSVVSLDWSRLPCAAACTTSSMLAYAFGCSRDCSLFSVADISCCGFSVSLCSGSSVDTDCNSTSPVIGFCTSRTSPALSVPLASEVACGALFSVV